MTPLRSKEFEDIRQFASERFGLDLRPGKERLVTARLGKQLEDGGFHSYNQYLQSVRDDRSGASLSALIDALTTNHTSFLREPQHFKFLVERVLPLLTSRRTVEIWCAAASTGEEPYTLVFSCLEASGPGLDIRVVASDISTRVLTMAERGVYPAARVAVLPPEWLRRYFLVGERSGEGYFRVKDEIRRRVAFRRINLVEPSPSGLVFPVIFCRNVMIYFDETTQRRVVGHLIHALEPGGFLFVGHAESLNGIEHGLECVSPAVYRKPGQLTPTR